MGSFTEDSTILDEDILIDILDSLVEKQRLIKHTSLTLLVGVYFHQKRILKGKFVEFIEKGLLIFILFI